MEDNNLKTLQFNKLTNDNAVFFKSGSDFLSLKYNDKEYAKTGFFQMFPLTYKDNYISVRESNEDADEIGIIINLDDFNEETVKLIKEQLELRYFMPIVTNILSIKREHGFAYFKTETDRGLCNFTIQTGFGMVRKLNDRLILLDIDSNRFEVNKSTVISSKHMRELEMLS